MGLRHTHRPTAAPACNASRPVSAGRLRKFYPTVQDAVYRTDTEPRPHVTLAAPFAHRVDRSSCQSGCRNSSDRTRRFTRFAPRVLDLVFAPYGPRPLAAKPEKHPFSTGCLVTTMDHTYRRLARQSSIWTQCPCRLMRWRCGQYSTVTKTLGYLVPEYVIAYIPSLPIGYGMHASHLRPFMRSAHFEQHSNIPNLYRVISVSRRTMGTAKNARNDNAHAHAPGLSTASPYLSIRGCRNSGRIEKNSKSFGTRRCFMSVKQMTHAVHGGISSEANYDGSQSETPATNRAAAEQIQFPG